MEDKGKIDEYNESEERGLFDGCIVMLSALLLCVPGHLPSAKKWKVTNAEDLMKNYIS